MRKRSSGAGGDAPVGSVTSGRGPGRRPYRPVVPRAGAGHAGPLRPDDGGAGRARRSIGLSDDVRSSQGSHRRNIVPAGRSARLPRLASPAPVGSPSMSATALCDPESKAIRRAFKARRRTELGLLVAASVIIAGAYALMIYGNTAKVPTDVAPLLAVMLGLGGVAHIANRIFVPERPSGRAPHRLPAQRAGLRDDPRASTWPTSSCTTTTRPFRRRGQPPGWPLTSSPWWSIRRSRDLDRYRYILLGLAVILLLLPLVPHLGITRHHRRCPALGASREVRVPAGGAGQDPAGHLLRLLLRREAGAADHPDGPVRQPPGRRPPAPGPHPAGLGASPSA